MMVQQNKDLLKQQMSSIYSYQNLNHMSKSVENISFDKKKKQFKKPSVE